tara:strand:+ start:1977 stop:2852 length:876 start_codon:yes stop_codon:yes gene_type:complete
MNDNYKKVSFTQYGYWNSCPFNWKLLYIDKIGIYKESIFALFGTSMHEVIQEYLMVMYNKTIKEANKILLDKLLMERLTYNYLEALKRNGGEEICDEKTIDEFYSHGVLILDWFKKRRANYFNKKNYDLVGVEVPIEYDISKNIKFIGYADIILYNKKNDRYKIIDIKTSTMGWNKYMKYDKNRTNQLLLYKHFYGLQNNISVYNIDVEYFIVKRKLYESADFPQKRIQVFSPASGTPSMKAIMETFNKFIKEAFVDNRYNEEREYEKIPSKKNCRYCNFNQTEYCDKGVK